MIEAVVVGQLLESGVAGRQGFGGIRDRETSSWSWAKREKGRGVRKFCLSWSDIAIVHAHSERLWLITDLAKTLNPNKHMRTRSALSDCGWGPQGQANIMPECQQWHHSMGWDPGLYRTKKLGQLLHCYPGIFTVITIQCIVQSGLCMAVQSGQ